MIKVSAIFPNYNGQKEIVSCLDSLGKLSYPQQKLEIIMIDNASTDSSIEVVKKRFPKVKIVSLKKNLGFAKAVNKGLQKASGDYLFVINNDITFARNFLTALVNFMEKNSKIGIIGGKIYYQKPKNKLLFTGLKFNSWLGSIQRLPYPNQIKESEWIQGCAMLIKRKVIEKIGLFDPAFFFSFEDLDFCHRARRAGFKIMYFPKAVAWHKEGATIDKQGLRKKATELYKGKFRYIFKNCSLPQIITSTLFQFLLVVPVRKLIVKNPPFFVRSMVAGFFYNLKLLPATLKKNEDCCFD